ncbi:thioredoxin-disulfide reductase, partial [bacterium]
MVHEVIIVGSGPAGYTAAIYAARADLAPLMFSGLEPGGQLMTTTDVENFPGFPQGVMGPDMMALFREQAARFGTDIRDQSVVSLDTSVRPFRLVSDSGETFRAHAVILSTGASAKWLGLPSEQHFRGYGVSACATCDGFFFRNRVVAVVGGGDTAMEETHFLAKFASKVYLIHRRDSFRASKIMQDRVLEDPKVEVLYNSEVVEVLGTDDPVQKVTGLRIGSLVGEPDREIPVDGFFLA